MFGKIFGKKEEMYNMVVYWDYNVDINDLMTDLDILGLAICKPSAFEKGSRIVIVRNWTIDNTNYRVAELYIDKATEKTIRGLMENKRFVAVKFTSTDMTKNGKVI